MCTPFLTPIQLLSRAIKILGYDKNNSINTNYSLAVLSGNRFNNRRTRSNKSQEL